MSKCLAASNAMIDSGVVASSIHALVRCYHSCVQQPNGSATNSDANASSSSGSAKTDDERIPFSPENVSISIENRIVLTAGLKLLYAIAILNTKAMAKALIQNEGKVNCIPEELAEAELSPKVEPIRGMGDLYAFLSLHILCASTSSESGAHLPVLHEQRIMSPPICKNPIFVWRGIM